MEDLPDALVQNILSRLDVPSLCAAASSCRRLHECTSQLIPHLKKFDLREFPPSFDDLKGFLQHTSKLQSLKLDCLYLDGQDLSLLLKPSLEEIHFQNVDAGFPRLISDIARCCPRLRFLQIDLRSWVVGSTNSFWTPDLETLTDCPTLESLCLTGGLVCVLDPYAFSAIARLSKLRTLSLGYVPERYAKELFSFSVEHSQWKKTHNKLFQLQNLQSLSLLLDRITDTFILLVCENLPCLVELELEDEPGEEPLIAFDLTTTGVQHLGACANLRRLMLARSQVSYPATFKRVEDLGFLFLAEKCSKLESIKLAGFSRISDASCREILHSFPNLHTFELLRSPRVTDLTFRDFSVISTKLMSVALVSCNLISNSSVKQLSYCRDLKSLNLKGCKSIGDGGLGAIATLEKLETLNLTGTDVSDMGLSTLGRGRTPLVFLSLYGCQRVSDDGVACLVEGSISQTLQELDLSNIPSLTDRAVLKLVHSGMKIVELRMRNCCNIGDTSLIALASMTCRGCGFGGSLRSLDLFNCKALTSLSIRWLRKPYFPRLRCLGLSWNILSQSVVDLLHQEHPHLRVLGYDLDFNGPDGEEIYQYSTDYGREDELERWMEGEDDY